MTICVCVRRLVLRCVECCPPHETNHTKRSRVMIMNSSYIVLYCACGAIDKSSAFIVASGAASRTTRSIPLAQYTSINNRLWSIPRRRRSPAAISVEVEMRHKPDRSTCLQRAVSSLAAASFLVAASVIAPVDAAAAARAGRQEPVVQAFVQLPDEGDDWTKLLADKTQSTGANMVITASKERGGKPALGANIAMDRLRFPVMMQLFPKNVIGGAIWPDDFDEKGTYAVEVVVCGPGQTRGGVCESPLPIVGSGESVFVNGLEDVPEIAENGGMRVPATIVLTPPSDRVLAPT